MRIQVLETFKSGVKTFVKTDVVTIDDDEGYHYVKNGWAKDLSGKVVTGNPDVGPVTLSIQNSKLGHKAETI